MSSVCVKQEILFAFLAGNALCAKFDTSQIPYRSYPSADRVHVAKRRVNVTCRGAKFDSPCNRVLACDTDRSCRQDQHRIPPFRTHVRCRQS